MKHQIPAKNLLSCGTVKLICSESSAHLNVKCVHQLYSDGEGTCTQTSYIFPVTLIQNDQ